MLRFDHGVVDVASRDLAWMIGNTFLAWVAVLVATAIDRADHRARLATLLLVLGGAGGTAVRLRDADPWKAVLVATVLVASAIVWAMRARRGDRWARLLGVLAIIAFTPNAPYVLTDVYHVQQDIRATGVRLGPALVFVIQYSCFLVPAAAAWIYLLDLGRRLLGVHRPGWPRPAALLLVSLVSAFGIYLGRILRLNSWDPIGHPREVARSLLESVTHVGPIAFTLVWAAVVLAVGWLGLWLLDRAHAAGRRGIDLILPLIMCVMSVLLVGATQVGRIYAAYGVVTPHPSRAMVLACVTLAVVVGAGAGTWLLGVLRLGRPVLRGIAGGVLLPLLGVAVIWAASGMWWAQNRGLCEYGPGTSLHGDACA